MLALIYKGFLAEKATFHSQKPVESAKSGQLTGEYACDGVDRALRAGVNGPVSRSKA